MAKPIVYGHRGSRGTHFENTRDSFLEAYACGAPWIETDVQLTRDNVAVIFHDDYVSGRLCRKKGKVVLRPKALRKLDWIEFTQYRIGSFVDYRYPKQEIPEDEMPFDLHQFLQFCKEKMPKLRINLELKVPSKTKHRPDLELYANIVAEAVHKAKMLPKVLISSFDESLVACFRQHHSDFAVSQLYDMDADFLSRVKDSGIKHVTLNYQLVTAEFAAQLNEHKITWNVFTPNRKSDWARLVELGVHGIITDYPRKLIKFLAAEK